MSDARIVNVVATGFLGTPLNLSNIVNNLPNVTYNPKKFSAAIYRVKDPKACFLLFSSGKFVCTGTTSASSAKDVSQRMEQSVQAIYQTPMSLSNFTIRNIVGTFSMGFPISLENFYDARRSYCIFGPEYFPGLKFTPSREEKKTVLLFVSGKVVITGCKKVDDIYEIADYMKRILLKFKR